MAKPFKMAVWCKECGKLFTLVFVAKQLGPPSDWQIDSARKDYLCDSCFRTSIKG